VPHFHAKYAGQTGVFSIVELRLISPRSQWNLGSAPLGMLLGKESPALFGGVSFTFLIFGWAWPEASRV
jgi:hypothetical protein